jgi:hypothetical protein
MANREFDPMHITLSELPQSGVSQCGLFICSASYEPRCLSVPLALSVSSVESIIVLKNNDVLGEGEKNGKKIGDKFGEKARIVEISKKNSITTADKIINALSIYKEKQLFSINIDISCMTHETVLILYSIFEYLYYGTEIKIKYFYVPATEYDPGVPYEQKWLSKGVLEVRSVLGFPGRLLPSRRNHLLILVGFEVERAVGLIEKFEPASLTLAYGDGNSFNEAHRLVNEQRHQNLSERFSNARNLAFSPRDAHKVRDLVLNEALQNPSRNLIVAPMNTKISTLGVALAATTNPDIQICYAAAKAYNIENYSSPEDYCVAFGL